MEKLTLGSLFDGIGGFCLAGVLSDIQPIWASEIEPFPVRVTEKRFPDVLQLGDVHTINGADIPPVSIITFGSPCQNLSIAGKRTGLDGEQSSLFYEAIRIIQEMRCKTNGQYPRWCVWENVPGALSSNNGQDFRQVLENLARVKDPTADVPMPESGKWLRAGEIVGNGYSVAWRILDASKGWGVAQRRKRIFAVLDLADVRAGQVLFESEGLSRYSPPLCSPRQTASAGSEGCSGAAGFCTDHSADSRGVGYGEEQSPTLRAGVVPGVAIEFHPADSRIRLREDGICQTLTSRMGTGGNNVPLTLKIRSGCEGGGKGPLIQENLSATLATNNDQTLFAPCAWDGSQTAPTLTVHNAGGAQRMPDKGNFNCVLQPHKVCAMHTSFYEAEEEQCPTLMARDWKDPPLINSQNGYLVRRLTPLECCRLQGYPDGWCDGLGDDNPSEQEIEKYRQVFKVWDEIQGKTRERTDYQITKWLQDPNTDSAEYKAYGNSVAVPCVFFVLAGIAWAEGKEDE